MKHFQYKLVGIATAALALSLAAEPMTVWAFEAESLCQSAGVASFLEADLTEEDYVAIADAAQGAHWGYTNLGIADTNGDYLNVRENPSVFADPIGRMKDHAACEVLEVRDGWASIVSGEVEGYVNCDFLLTGMDAVAVAKDTVRTVAVSREDNLNVRTEPSEKSRVLTRISRDTELEYVETLGEWAHVKLKGEDAYVFAQYVDIETKLETAMTMTQALYGEDVSDLRVELVEFAKQFVGNPYVWGGTSLTNGADCSGFVQSVFKNFGITLSRNSRAQAENGVAIQASELMPGDLVFYSKDGTINHVALYIGNGQVVHASSPTTGIKISDYDYRTPTRCRRVIED